VKGVGQVQGTDQRFLLISRYHQGKVTGQDQGTDQRLLLISRHQVKVAGKMKERDLR
jgi:hypothetical protein